MGNKVAVLLAGCGHQDGAEISEAVLSLLALRQQNLLPEIFALDQPLVDVHDHIRHQPVAETRNMLTEAARIARGEIRPVSALDPKQYAGLVIPGGSGVAKNFCDFASQGAQASVQPDIARVVGAFLDAKKPIMAICISPVVVGLVAAQKKLLLSLTLGDAQNEASKNLAQLKHMLISKKSEEILIDEAHKVVSSPAYMYNTTVDKIWPGIEAAAKTFAKWVQAL